MIPPCVHVRVITTSPHLGSIDKLMCDHYLNDLLLQTQFEERS